MCYIFMYSYVYWKIEIKPPNFGIVTYYGMDNWFNNKINVILLSFYYLMKLLID
jgi:hypothetical protein